MLKIFNQFVYVFWIFFVIIDVLLLGICIWWDGFWIFVKEDLGEVILCLVCFALVCEILIRTIKTFLY